MTCLFHVPVGQVRGVVTIWRKHAYSCTISLPFSRPPQKRLFWEECLHTKATTPNSPVGQREPVLGVDPFNDSRTRQKRKGVLNRWPPPFLPARSVLPKMPSTNPKPREKTTGVEF